MSDQGDARQVTVVEEQGRFAIYVDGEEAGFADFIEEEGLRDFNHTVVDEAFRGQGLSKPLIQASLDATREAGLQIRATCSAYQGFVAKHPEYADLVAEA